MGSDLATLLADALKSINSGWYWVWVGMWFSVGFHFIGWVLDVAKAVAFSDTRKNK